MSIRSSGLALLMAVPMLAGAGGPASEPSVTHSSKDASLQWGPCPPFMPKGCEITVLHGDPSKPNVDVFFRVPAGYELPHHWHTSAERMTLSSGELTVQYDGQPAVTLKPGMYAYGPAKLAHKGACSKAGPCVLFIAFESALDAFPVETSGK